MDNRQYRKFIHLVQCHQHDKHTDDLQAHHGRNKEKYRKRARFIDEVNYNPICMTCLETVTWESVHGESFSATVQRNKSFGISVFEGRHRKFSTINFSAAFQEAISYEKDNYTDAFERIWREVHHGTRKLPGPNHDTYAKWLDSVTPTAEECFGIEWEEQEEEELAVRKVDPTQYLPDISECPIFVRRGQEEQGRNIVDEDGKSWLSQRLRPLLCLGKANNRGGIGATNSPAHLSDRHRSLWPARTVRRHGRRNH